MTRRRLLEIGAGAAVIATGGAVVANTVANTVVPVAPARLEGIWPYCVWWRMSRLVCGTDWRLATKFHGIPLKTFKHFDGECDNEHILTLPFPPSWSAEVVRVTGRVYRCRVREGRVDVMFRGRDWLLPEVGPLLIVVDLVKLSVTLL